uniref:Uncharacterized protein n=1 Tax=Lepeophtheirus salmonis TaxID=72036 RepID=A0A0K2U387_LEPSM
MLKGSHFLDFVPHSVDTISFNRRIMHCANTLHIKVYDIDFWSHESLPLCSRIHKFLQIFY